MAKAKTRGPIASGRTLKPPERGHEQLGNKVLFLMPSSHIENQALSLVISLNLTKESVALTLQFAQRNWVGG
jgi:hypothetical protein